MRAFSSDQEKAPASGASTGSKCDEVDSKRLDGIGLKTFLALHDNEADLLVLFQGLEAL